MSRILKNNLEDFSIDKRNWQGIASMDIDGHGNLFASWYSGGDGEGSENYTLICKSIDNGLTFSQPISIVAPEGKIRAYDPAVFTDPSDSVRWYWAESYGMYDGRCGVWESIYDGENFTTPRRICDGIMINKPTILKDGKWLLPASIWDMRTYLNKPGDTNQPVNRIPPGSYVVLSEDGGETFDIQGAAHPDKISCDEHMVIEREDGSLWMLIRTRYGIGESFSFDGGSTWTDTVPSSINSPASRFFIRRLPSGRLLLINHVNFKANDNLHIRRNNLTALISEDDGKTWPYRLLLDERTKVSYPDAAFGENGEIYIIYDHDRYECSEILTARITEKEILDGRLSYPSSYLKNTISSRIPIL